MSLATSLAGLESTSQQSTPNMEGMNRKIRLESTHPADNETEVETTSLGTNQDRLESMGPGSGLESMMSLESMMIMSRNTTDDKPYSCSICGKCFNRTDNLKSHFRVHTGEKPYRCPDCGRGFSTKSNLNAHFRQVHKRMQNPK